VFLVWQNFQVGSSSRYLPCPGGGWWLLSPDTVTARREVPPVAGVQTGDGERRNRRLRIYMLGHSVPP